MDADRVRELIKACQAEADAAIREGNPPFGCVITDADGTIVARGHNTQNSDNDPTAHAEINALRQLGQKVGSRYLDGYVMFANASNCSMCMSAAIKARIKEFYYGAPPEPNMNPSLPMEDVAAKASGSIRINGPILGDECARQITVARRGTV